MKETYLYDKAWLYSDDSEIEIEIPNTTTLYRGSIMEIPDGMLINYGYHDDYFRMHSELGRWVLIVEYDYASAPIVLITTYADAMWRHNIDASLLPPQLRQAIFSAMKDAVKRASLTGLMRVRDELRVFNKEIK